MPKRIQRMRTKGWRMPGNAVYVGRPTKWGNPYRVGSEPWMSREMSLAMYETLMTGELPDKYISNRGVEYRNFVHEHAKELRGKDLACWCKEGDPCHADVLLEIANKCPALEMVE